MHVPLRLLTPFTSTFLLAVLFICRSFPAVSAQTADLPKPLTLDQVWSLDSTYTDQQHGIIFRYPSVWKPATQFGYIPPALTLAAGSHENQIPMRVTGFGYLPGEFPRRAVGPYTATNLEGFGLVYSVLAVPNAAECDQKASYVAKGADNTRLSSVRIAGHSYAIYRIAGEAMNQTYAGRLYATYSHGACYLIETGVAAVVPGASINGQLPTPASVHGVAVHLWRLMETVRIFPKR
jgi:hypothetical protein